MNVNFIGRLAADAVLRDGKDGTQFVTFRMAVDEYNPSTRQNETAWISCIDSAPRTVKIIEHLKKGSMLYVTGEERVSLFSGANGVNINREVRVYNWNFVSTGRRDENATTETTAQSAPVVVNIPSPTVTANATTGTFVPPVSTVAAATSSPITDDDLPF